MSAEHGRAFRSMITAFGAGDRDGMGSYLAESLVAYVTKR